MRVTIDVDEDIWDGIMEHIIREHKAVYGKYRKKVVNDILALGLRELKKGNVEEFRKAISRDVSEDFLESAEALSKEIREEQEKVSDTMNLCLDTFCNPKIKKGTRAS